MLPLAFDPRPTTLTGSFVRLEPLSLSHACDLFDAGGDDATWTYMPRSALRSIEEAEAMIREAAEETQAGREVAFAIIALPAPSAPAPKDFLDAIAAAPGAAVGSTRFLDIQRAHRALEIGWTWIGAPWRRSAINTECKLLLLEHAFEVHGAHRVTLKTDARNERSQRAIERIGGVREGVLRRHRIGPDGFVRDTVYYGILDQDWPQVKARLTAMLTAR